MTIEYFGNKSWLDITREERLYCSYLYHEVLRIGVPEFVEWLNERWNYDKKLYVPKVGESEIGYEVCFYRDMLFNDKTMNKGLSVKEINRDREESVRFPPKRTFDLCIFSNREIVIIEAKAQQSFGDPKQANSLEKDEMYIRQLFNHFGFKTIPEIRWVLISGSNYKNRQGKYENKLRQDPRLYKWVTWKDLSGFNRFSDDCKRVFENAEKLSKENL